LDAGIAVRVQRRAVADLSLRIGELNLDDGALATRNADAATWVPFASYTFTPAPPGQGWMA
jgi:hypothetical protein